MDGRAEPSSRCGLVCWEAETSPAGHQRRLGRNRDCPVGVGRSFSIRRIWPTMVYPNWRVVPNGLDGLAYDGPNANHLGKLAHCIQEVSHGQCHCVDRKAP